jgi:hypothetical protein
MGLFAAFLAGCSASTPPPMPPPPMQPNTPLPPPAQPNTPLPSPTAEATAQNSQSDIFKLVQTVQVTSDDVFLAGGFIRLGYVPATDRIVAAFGTPKLAKPGGGCMDKAYGYKEYTTDMQPAGKSGILNCEAGDSSELFVDNTLFDVSTYPVNNTEGWRIEKFDATTWKKTGSLDFALDAPREGSGDMMIAYINGMLDISSGHSETGGPPDIMKGTSSHHDFFSTGLVFQKKMVLSDTPHITGMSMIYLDGTYYFLSAGAYADDVIVMQYDADWHYLGVKTLRKLGHFPEGLAFDGKRFYIAYMDNSLHSEPMFLPIYPNIRLAAFDRDCILIEDIAVTNYAKADDMTTARPFLLLHDNRLYVSYDEAPRDANHMDIIEKIQAYVSVFELNADS